MRSLTLIATLALSIQQGWRMSSLRRQRAFEVIEACGRVVALRQPTGDGSLSSDVFVADIGVLFGVVIELGEHGAPEITLQDSLF